MNWVILRHENTSKILPLLRLGILIKILLRLPSKGCLVSEIQIWALSLLEILIIWRRYVVILLIDDYLRSVIVIDFTSITLGGRISSLVEWVLIIFPKAARAFNFTFTVVLLVRVEIFQVLLVILAALPSMVCFLVQRVKKISHKHLVHGILIVTKVSLEVLGIELSGEKTIVKSKFMRELLPIILAQAWFVGRVLRRALTTTRLRITRTGT